MKPLLCILLGSGLIAGVGCDNTTKPPGKTEKPDAPLSEKDLVLQDLQQKIDTYPDSVRLYDKLIDTLVSFEDYKSAGAIATQLINRGADSNYYYWFVKGDIYRRGKMYDSAAAAYNAYLRKFPDDEQILLNLANTYAEAGNAGAVDLTTSIAHRFPNRQMRSEAFFIKGVYYNQVKQYTEARRWLDSTLLLNYNYAEAYMEKGYSFFDEAKYKEAHKTFSTLTDLNNQYADGWYWKGKCEEALGKKKEAAESYTQAYTIDPSIKEAKEAVERLGSISH
jgi:tetratricopeptide (TPR) repeat protein